jgi:hypothetical protein
MRQHKLRLDDLFVETFSTIAEDGHRGTVNGHQEYETMAEGCDSTNQFTCMANQTCYPQFTCVAGQTCDPQFTCVDNQTCKPDLTCS